MQAIYRALIILIRIIEIFIFIRVLFNLLGVSMGSPIVGFIYEMTEPIIGPCRKLLYKLGLGGGMFDFSPALALVLLNVLKTLLLKNML
ncbi:MAG TPA: YggT family protein [Tissierellales bacterium]|nr:YggT family protein [Tissierellales bacterium]